MKKKIGNIILGIATVAMLLYLMSTLNTTQQILVMLHFGFLAAFIYGVLMGFGEVNKRLDILIKQKTTETDDTKRV